MITYVAGFPAFAAVEKHPVKDAILGLAQCLQNLREQLPKEVVVRRFLEAKLSDVVEIDAKFLWKRSTPLSFHTPK